MGHANIPRRKEAAWRQLGAAVDYPERKRYLEGVTMRQENECIKKELLIPKQCN